MTSSLSDITAEILGRPRAVIGAGTQGRRIALMLASQGGEVRICARSSGGREAAKSFVEENLAEIVKRVGGNFGCIVPCESMEAAVANAGLAIEAVPEQLELKKEIFRTLDRLAPADTVLGSNSSSYPTSQIIDAVTRPERVLNMHFYMPPLQNAVELMSCGMTKPELILGLMEILPRFGLEPYHVQRESVGFIFNRIWAAIKRESLTVVADGVATPKDVDRIFQSVLRSAEAPFRLMDKVGLDVVLDIEEHYAAAAKGHSSEGPRALLRRYVHEGRLGQKTGRGFYDDYS
jgi:3-hydroxybutyryl-CoA dehydrogenase